MNQTAKGRRALVTGASGFIGSHLLEHLHRAGWQVAVIARPASFARLSTLPTVTKTYVYKGETNEVVDAVADFRPEIVFHLSSLFLAQHDATRIEPLILSNVLFGTQLLEAMRLAKVTAFVNAGTAWQNFADDGYSPVNLYAATKQAFEDILTYYVQTASIRAVTLRLFDTYGPDDTRTKILALLLNCLRTQEPLNMSPGDQILDLTYVDDVCSALIHAAERVLGIQKSGHEVFALSSGERHTLRETVALFEEVAGKSLPVNFGARPYREREVMVPWNGPQMAGWQARVSLREGIARLLIEAKKTS